MATIACFQIHIALNADTAWRPIARIEHHPCIESSKYKGQLMQKDITGETVLLLRTIRYTLTLLVSEGIVSKQLSFRDSRQGLYRVNNDTQDSSWHSKQTVSP